MAGVWQNEALKAEAFSRMQAGHTSCAYCDVSATLTCFRRMFVCITAYKAPAEGAGANAKAPSAL